MYGRENKEIVQAGIYKKMQGESRSRCKYMYIKSTWMPDAAIKAHWKWVRSLEEFRLLHNVRRSN